MNEAADFVSLFTIVALAAICPLLANRVPRHIIPETVFLLVAGCALGPYGFANLIDINETIGFLSELGCAFLFLLAGYEIEPQALLGKQGQRGLVTWVVSFGLAALVIAISPLGLNTVEGWAIAIMLTTTAIGTLMPILAERKLIGTPVGEAVISYGTWGELGPVLAIVLLLSSRSAWQTIVILLALTAFCVFISTHASRARKEGHRFFQFLEAKADTTSQTFVRFTIFLLITLVTISALFKFDIVLGAFAAGFVLRFVVPEGNKSLEMKLDGIGYGFFIPLFFICSGAKINIASVTSRFDLFFLFIFMLILVRAIPIFVATCTDKNLETPSKHACAAIAMYCTTALPLVVAASSIAVNAGAMGQDVASVLVAAGAATVFLMPLLSQAVYSVADAHEIGCIEHEVAIEESAPKRTTPHPMAYFSFERMLSQGADSMHIARTIAERLEFADDEERIEHVAKRIEALRKRHEHELGKDSLFSKKVR